MIPNCALNPKYPVIPDRIYRPDIPLLHGGMKGCRNPSKKVPIITLWIDILIHYNNIKLYMSFFYKNVISFLYTKPSKITFFTAEMFISRTRHEIIQELHTFTKMYKTRGVNTNVYHRNNEFNINDLREHISP